MAMAIINSRYRCKGSKPACLTTLAAHLANHLAASGFLLPQAPHLHRGALTTLTGLSLLRRAPRKWPSARELRDGAGGRTEVRIG
jgi:hypothetical protein